MHIRMEDIKTLLCKIIGSLKISVHYLQIDAILLTSDCFLGQCLSNCEKLEKNTTCSSFQTAQSIFKIYHCTKEQKSR